VRAIVAAITELSGVIPAVAFNLASRLPVVDPFSVYRGETACASIHRGESGRDALQHLDPAAQTSIAAGGAATSPVFRLSDAGVISTSLGRPG